MPEEENTALLEIEKAKKAGANLLLPSTNIRGLSEFHAPVIDSVLLSPNSQDGDVYPDGSGENSRLRLAAQGLRKLSVCAGILWHPGECRRTDNRQDRNYVSYQAVGGIKKTDGTPVWWKGEYDLDFEVVEEELRELHINKSKNWRKSDTEKQVYVESSVKRDMLFKRKHKIKLAETGAANRVIRAILGLKASYTKAELAKPFVMVRIIFKPDYSDPEVKRQITQAAIQAMTGVYGPAPAIQEVPPIDLPPEDYHTIPGDDDTPPAAADNNNSTKPVETTAPAKTSPPDTEKKESTATETFLSLPDEEQQMTLDEIAQEKGYDMSGLSVPTAKMDVRNRGRLFEHLSALPPQPDEIPF